MTSPPTTTSWTSAWIDALAFALGLAAALLGGWTAADLVWSLWLSSLVVGYSMIVWRIVRPFVTIARGLASEPVEVRRTVTEHGIMPFIGIGSVAFVVALFMLGFFTVHFGMFHYVHSQFLAMFFPVVEGAPRTTTGFDTYAEVARRYWTFLPAAFLAERAAFSRREERKPPDVSVTAAAIAARKAAAGRGFDGMMAPYRNVVRMHLLIFFFAFASVAALDTFAVYAVVYAVYFFPWRLLRRGRGEIAPAGA